MIVGKFAGWLMYLPGLPNCVLMFHNSTGSSITTSLILHHLVFLVAWFSMCRWCPSCSIWTIQYPGLHFRSHFLVVYFWNRLCCPFWKMMVLYLWFSGPFWSNFHPVFSWQWLGLDGVLPDWVSQVLDLLGIIAPVLEVGVMAGWGVFHRLGKNGVSAVARFGVTL